MRTSSRMVAILLFDEVELLDVAAVLSILGSAGRQWNYRPFRLVPVGARPGLIETRSQIRLEAKAAFADCPAPEIVVVPGGYGARRALGDANITQYLRDVAPSVSQFLSVGNGALLLAQAGLVAGLDVALPADAVATLGESAPTARPDVVARFRSSGNVVSAAGSGGAVDAALHLVSKLLGRKQAEVVAVSLGFIWTEGEIASVTIVDQGE